MISQEKFIKEVTGKKEVIQGRFVRILRTISFLPLKIKSNLGKAADFTYLTICRQNDFDMVAASLYTLFKTSELLPNNIAIVSDGSWLPEVGEKYFKKFGIMDLEYNTRWSMKEITSEISDLRYPFRSRTIKYDVMIACHYLCRLKWLYWKDYLKMRMRKI